MKERAILFKGMLDGLHIQMEQDTELTKLKEELEKKLEAGKNFFQGTAVNLIFTGKSFKEDEKQEIMDYIATQIEIGSVEFRDSIVEEKSDSEWFDGIEEGMTRFFRGTVRNGQRIAYQGNVVIIGDVNPGGEVVAGGNIVVFGTLRGMAHAGATGNSQAVVSAFCLQPTQLRIGTIITRPPEEGGDKPSYPEVAHVKDENLVIEPYLPGRGK